MSARDELECWLIDHGFPNAYDVSHAVIAAGWKSGGEVAETREKFARTVTALNGRFQESVTEVVRGAKEAAWDEGAQAAFYSPDIRGQVDYPANPYARSETP